MRAILCFLVLVLLTGSFSQDVKAEKAKLAKLRTAYATSKNAYAKDRSNAKAKNAYAGATLKYANATMYSPALGPKVKYPAALRLYREVLVVDPKNKVAIASRDTIEAIYKSMKREIPK